MNLHRAAPFLLALTVACSGSSTDTPGGDGDGDGNTSKDKTAPLLTVETPLRGTLADGSSVVVSGTVSDEGGVAGVTVNGQAAELSGDRFEVTLTVEPGMTLLETVATDEAGNAISDVRALLAGSFAPQGTPVANGIVARLGRNELGVLGGMVRDFANNTDFGQIARDASPVAHSTALCDADIFIDDVTINDVVVTAVPTAGGIDVDVRVVAPDVDARIEYDTCVFSGTLTGRVWADDLRIQGKLGLSLDGSGLKLGVSGAGANFTNFKVDIDGIPGFIDGWVQDQARDKVADVIRDQITGMVPDLANDFLADFTQGGWQVGVLEQTVELFVRPTAVSFDSSGGTIALETNANLLGVEGASYFSSPVPAPSADAMGAEGFRVALADDVANQILAGFWASGALERDLPVGEGNPATAIFGDEIDRISLNLMLPPTLTSDMATGSAILTLGDLMVEIADDDEGGLGVMARFAVSAEISLQIQMGPGGRMMLVTGEPTIWAKVLEKSPNVALNITDDLVATLAKTVIDQIADRADGLLESLPLPTIGSAMLTQPTITPIAGYLILAAQVQ